MPRLPTATLLAALTAPTASAQQPELLPDALVTIGDDADEALHGVVAAVLTDDALVLAETSTHSLRFHDRRTGALIRAVGRKGEGPGDFGNLDLLQAVGDRLHTFDSWLMRVTVWTMAGDVERTVRVRPWGDYNALNVEGFFPDGSMLVSGWVFDWPDETKILRDELELARLDAEGNFIATVGAYRGYEYYSSPRTRSIYSHRRIAWSVEHHLWKVRASYG